MKKFSGIILAAGEGKRFGGKKQFIKYKGKELYKYPLKVALECLDEVVVVGVDIKGGKTRQESVLKGLKAISGDYVIILEAARPLVTKEQVELLKKEVIEHNSVSFCKPLVNTVYNGEYIRKGAVELLVPQVFKTELLLTAHQETSLKNALDDTSIVNNVYGLKPKLIETKGLYKITYPEDLKIIKVYESSNNRG